MYDLRQINLDYTLEEGFTVQVFSESLDFASRVALVQNAFDNSSYTEGNLKGLMASPDYIDEYNCGTRHLELSLRFAIATDQERSA